MKRIISIFIIFSLLFCSASSLMTKDVSAAEQKTSIKLNASIIKLKPGETFQLKFNIVSDDITDEYPQLRMSGYDGSIEMNENGLITAYKPGVTTITAIINSGAEARCNVIVYNGNLYEQYKLDETSVKLKPSEKIKLKLTISGVTETDEKITWYSGNTKVATVDSRGLVTAKKGGTAIITAKSASGINEKCTVKVYYKVTYKLNGGKNRSENLTYYKSKLNLSKPTKKGYIFKGWYTNKNFSSKSKVTSLSKTDKTVYAKWAKVSVGKCKALKLSQEYKSRIYADWTGISEADGYVVKYSQNKNFSNAKTKTVKKSNAALWNLSNKKTYYVKVKAYKTDSTGKKIYGSYNSAKLLKINNKDKKEKEPVYGTISFKNKNMTSDWYWEHATVIWSWNSKAKIWDQKVRIGGGAPDNLWEYVDKAFPNPPSRKGRYNGEKVSDTVWVYLGGGRQ